jgi:hypothetical protein
MAAAVLARATPGRSRRVAGPLLLAGGVLLASVALHVRDPHQQGSWGVCPWYILTGLYCPGCGGLRAVNDLTDGQVLQAASSNLLLVAAAPVLAGLWVRALLDRWRGVARHPSTGVVPALAVGLAVAAVVFAVVRNLPSGAWLAP